MGTWLYIISPVSDPSIARARLPRIGVPLPRILRFPAYRTFSASRTGGLSDALTMNRKGDAEVDSGLAVEADKRVRVRVGVGVDGPDGVDVYSYSSTSSVDGATRVADNSVSADPDLTGKLGVQSPTTALSLLLPDRLDRLECNRVSGVVMLRPSPTVLVCGPCRGDLACGL